MNYIFISWLLTQFFIYFFIFFRMAQTNKDEWFNTPYIHGSLIGGIIGLVFGATTGYVLYKVSGLYLGAMYGLIIGSIAFTINLYIFNYKTKKEREWRQKIIKNAFSKHK